MNTINFIASGKMGDFIHSLYAVKNICEQKNAKANICLVNGYDGDIWTYGIEKAYLDLFDLVTKQPYVCGFNYTNRELPFSEYINLNKWRVAVADTHAKTGKYDTCWTELLSAIYEFPIPPKYAWLEKDPDDSFKNTILIHRSNHHHNDDYPFWDNIIPEITGKKDKVAFIVSDIKEADYFIKGSFGFIEAIWPQSVSSMALAIANCKYFIGNLSAPFALASAFDVPRLCELDADPAPFEMGEHKYSANLSWILNDEIKHFSHNLIVQH